MALILILANREILQKVSYILHLAKSIIIIIVFETQICRIPTTSQLQIHEFTYLQSLRK